MTVEMMSEILSILGAVFFYVGFTGYLVVFAERQD